MTGQSPEAGYSLVEILVVLVVIAFASSVIVMQARPSRPAAAPTLAERVDAARSTALRSGTPVLVVNAASKSLQHTGSVVVFPDGSLSRLVDLPGAEGGALLGVSRRSVDTMEVQR